MRFCNKQCEKEAHTKDKSTKKEPKNSSDTEDLLKKEMEAEMKRNEKIERRDIRAVKQLSSGCWPSNKDTFMKFEAVRRSN